MGDSTDLQGTTRSTRRGLVEPIFHTRNTTSAGIHVAPALTSHARPYLGVLVLAAVLSLALAACVGLPLWTHNADFDSREASVEHTHDVIRESLEFVGALTSAEAALRGYILTKEPDQARLIETERDAAISHLQALHRLTAGNPQQQGELAELDPLVAAKIDRMMLNSDNVRTGNNQGVLAMIREGTGFQLMVSIREVIGRIVAEEQRLLADRKASAARSRAELMEWLRLGMVVTFTLLLLTSTSIIIMFRHRQRANLAEAQATRHDQALATLRSLFAVSPVGMARSRIDGTVLEANQAFLQTFEATEADIAADGLNWNTLTAPEWRDRQPLVVRDLSEKGRCGPFEGDYLLPDGQRKPVVVAMAKLDGADDEFAAFVIDLTASRRLQTELAEANMLWQGIFASSSDCFKVLDLDGRLLSLNGAACKKLRLQAPDEVLGRIWDGLWPEAQGAALRAAMDAARGGAQGRFTAPTTDDEGHVRWWDVIITPILGTDGQPRQLVAVSRDITTLKASEAALRQSEARLRSIVDTAADGILVATSDGRIVSANAAALRMFAYESDETLIGQDLSVLMPSGDAARHGAYLAAHRTGGPPRAIGVPGRELIARRRDGSEFPIGLSVSSFSTADGRYLTGMIRDVSTARQAEAALRNSEARLRLALRSAALGVFEVDVARGAVRYDERASEISDGLVPANLWVAMDDPAFVDWLGRTHPDDADDRARHIAALSAGDVSGFEHTFRAWMPDRCWHHFTCAGIAPDQDAATHHALRLVGVISDVTDRAEAAATLERLVDERTRAWANATQELEAEMHRREEAQATLLHTQKMEALGQLTSGIAHDFNNILNAIKGSFHFIRKQTSDESMRKMVVHGEQSVDRATALVRRLLAFARGEKLEVRLVDSSEMLESIRTLVRHSVGSDVEIVVQSEPDLWPVLADQHVLEVALLNLAINARDAMPDGGTLAIEARNVSATDTHPATVAAGDYLVIAVTDTGTGMPPDVMAKALTPFFTTKPPGRGTGLGLPMVNDFAHQSGGALAIRSTPGAGTTIEIYLPRAEIEPLPKQTAVAVATGGNTRILLVDDDEAVRAFTAGYLDELGYTVLEAKNTDAAFALATATTDIDLIVTDIVMPGADGLSLAAKLRGRPACPPIVFITGYADGHDLSGEKVLPKPFTIDTLGRFVATSLQLRQSSGAMS